MERPNISTRGEEPAPLVVAVVLTWNDTRMTAACVGSLFDSDYARLRVVVVDNGSDTRCGEVIKRRFPAVDLVVLPRNLGFTGGANRGIERAFELGADFVHLLNNDATVASNVVSSLLTAMTANPQVGAASPLVLFPGADRIVAFYTGSVDRDIAMHDNHDFRQPVHTRTWPTTRSDFVPFVAVMFRRSALEEVGRLDESLSTCWEDFDFCLRLLDANWRIITVGDAHVTHECSQTTGERSPYITYYLTRNRLICLLRYARPEAMLRRSLHILRTFYWEVRAGRLSWGSHWAFLMGLLDFLHGVRGTGWGFRASTLDPE